jgi:glycosyltransferase involved in cell wall biosynthesis
VKKINLLFDSTSLIEGIKTKHVSRSGIYWVADNILRQFIFCKIYNITLLYPPCSFVNKKHIANNYQFKFKCVTFYNKSKCKLNISQLKNKILKSKNIIKIFYYILKININFLYIFLSYGFEKKIKHIDVFFSPMYAVPKEVIKNTSIRSFQLLHDCIPSIFRDLYPFIDSGHWYLNLIENLNKETTYFCVSQCTKKDFLSLFSEKINKNRVFVTPNASAREFIPQYNREIFQKTLKNYAVNLTHDVNYIFSLCTLEPRKNLLFTVKFFIEKKKKNKIDNLYFFLCGGYFPGFIEQFKQKLSEFSDYRDKIIMFGYVNDEDINILYSNSLFFVYLSQYEGFGMPPLEAMQAGTPVICSNNSSLPEVVGDAAITIDYDSEEQCINAFEKFYFNNDLRKEYINKGFERSKLFSWEKTFDMMSKIIMETVGNDG